MQDISSDMAADFIKILRQSDYKFTGLTNTAVQYLSKTILDPGNTPLEDFTFRLGEEVTDKDVGIEAFEILYGMDGLMSLCRYMDRTGRYKRSVVDTHSGVVIAGGSFSKIYKVGNIAIKQISALEGDEFYDPYLALNEIFILGMLSTHANVMCMQSFIADYENVYIVSELAINDLATLLYADKKEFTMEEWKRVYIDNNICEHNPLSINVRSRYIRELFSGLDYIHKSGFIHRDIKPQNLLIMSDGRLDIADFGSARFFMHNPSHTISSFFLAGSYRYVGINLLKKFSEKTG